MVFSEWTRLHTTLLCLRSLPRRPPRPFLPPPCCWERLASPSVSRVAPSSDEDFSSTQNSMKPLISSACFKITRFLRVTREQCKDNKLYFLFFFLKIFSQYQAGKKKRTAYAPERSKCVPFISCPKKWIKTKFGKSSYIRIHISFLTSLENKGKKHQELSKIRTAVTKKKVFNKFNSSAEQSNVWSFTVMWIYFTYWCNNPIWIFDCGK